MKADLILDELRSRKGFNVLDELDDDILDEIKYEINKIIETPQQLSELLEQRDEMLAMLEELYRRYEIIQSEPSGIVRETMIDSVFIDLDFMQLIKKVKNE